MAPKVKVALATEAAEDTRISVELAEKDIKIKTLSEMVQR